MGGLHVSSHIVKGTASTRTQKIDEELLFPIRFTFVTLDGNFCTVDKCKFYILK